jgi:hypothetical protein
LKELGKKSNQDDEIERLQSALDSRDEKFDCLVRSIQADNAKAIASVREDLEAEVKKYEELYKNAESELKAYDASHDSWIRALCMIQDDFESKFLRTSFFFFPFFFY